MRTSTKERYKDYILQSMDNTKQPYPGYSFAVDELFGFPNLDDETAKDIIRDNLDNLSDKELSFLVGVIYDRNEWADFIKLNPISNYKKS